MCDLDAVVVFFDDNVSASTGKICKLGIEHRRLKEIHGSKRIRGAPLLVVITGTLGGAAVKADRL